MGANLKKFVNPKFTRTVPLDHMRRLLARHEAQLIGFDFSMFDRDAGLARLAIQDFFAGPEAGYPEGLIADLHRIAAVGTRHGLSTLLEEARRRSVALVGSTGARSGWNAKHFALIAFLHHPEVFTAAADRLAYFSSTAIAELIGRTPGVAVDIDATQLEGLKSAAATLFEAELLGEICRVGSYPDGDEVIIVLTHGTRIVATSTVEGGQEAMLCYRPLDTAFLAYSAAEGRLKMRRIAKALRAPLAEAFATHVLSHPGFFAGTGAHDLYTLDPIERAWPNFQWTHSFDPLIRAVRIIEVSADRVSPGLFPDHPGNVNWSVVTQDSNDCALARLREMRPGIRFDSGDWRLGHVTVRVYIEAGDRRPSPVTVMIRPKGEATFRRERFEGRIMELLRRNGFCHDQAADFVAIAAE